MINRGGEKIYSLEVETFFRHSEDLRGAVVVSRPRDGEVVKACIALKPGEMQRRGDSAICAGVGDYKVPKFVEFMEGLPGILREGEKAGAALHPS